MDASAQDPLEAVRALTGGRGPDYVFEVVGRPETIRLAYSMVRRGGTAVVVGAGSADDQVAFNAMELFADAKTLVGSVYGSADPDRDFPMLVGLIQSGALDAGRAGHPADRARRGRRGIRRHGGRRGRS